MSEPNVTETVKADLSKAGAEVDHVLKPKVTVPLWVLAVAFAVGNVVALVTHL